MGAGPVSGTVLTARRGRMENPTPKTSKWGKWLAAGCGGAGLFLIVVPLLYTFGRSAAPAGPAAPLEIPFVTAESDDPVRPIRSRLQSRRHRPVRLRRTRPFPPNGRRRSCAEILFSPRRGGRRSTPCWPDTKGYRCFTRISAREPRMNTVLSRNIRPPAWSRLPTASMFSISCHRGKRI